MFTPHTAEINISRQEPNIEEVEKAKALLHYRFERIAVDIATKDLIKKDRTKEEVRRAKKKFSNQLEFDDKLSRFKNFVDIFNRWRGFYTDFTSTWNPKNIGQMRAIDRIVSDCNENDMDLGIFIACSFKACARRRFKTPTVTNMANYGEDWYYEYAEDVIADIDAEEYS